MLINYNKLIDRAMLNVIKEALSIFTANHNLVLDNHFYISFYTPFPGVGISERLRQKYPEHMTIVLQHQFSNLKINDNNFSVCLSFSGVLEDIVIPWGSISLFSDPSTQVSIKFSYYINEFKKDNISKAENRECSTANIAPNKQEKSHTRDVIGDQSKIITLNKFRQPPKD